jgi:[FeFe] hydrogenase H-cluster maturation GTPase HydF
MRLHIGLFGRRNVGKSSLLNALTQTSVSIVSAEAGTTTDPVEKPMELLPIGPVLFIDTAGVDDVGALGQMRVERTHLALDRTDLGVIVLEAGIFGAFEEALVAELARRGTPTVLVFNKCDVAPPDPGLVARLRADKHTVVEVSALTGAGLAGLREALLLRTPSDFLEERPLVSDLVGPGELCVLVVPVDKEAPKGRLILPQAQTIRDLLDHDAMCLVTKERELRAALDGLTRPPALVVTDSQAFLKVVADTPPGTPLTSFSILFARYEADLPALVRGTLAIERLRSGDRVLIAEGCTHHPIGEDIARVKIPRWLTQFTGARLEFEWVRGHDFPMDLSPYAIAVHCGNCTGNRKSMLTRLHRAETQGVPMTNFGLTIAYSLGIFERALEPFPAALLAYRAERARALSAD